MTVKPLDTLPPTETLEIENGLSLVPRVKLILTVHPSLSTSATKPIDEWKLKRALIDFLKTSLLVSVPEEDLKIKGYKDIKKRKRDDAVAHGTLCIRDLGLLDNEKNEDLEVKEKKFADWRRYIVEKMDGIELNLEGYEYKLSVALPESDDFEGMRKAWEDAYAFGNRGYSRGGGRQEPDTIVMRGVPSRWVAEPRVSSSKPSPLVTHTIFSTFGELRKLDVSEDNDYGKDADEDGGDLISGLHCKIVVQFEKHRDFYNTLKVLCGRSLQKQGSRLKADYEVTWAKESFFRNSSTQAKERNDRMSAAAGGRYRNEAPRHDQYNSQFTSDDTRRKRFKE
ncbi:uncharacterized protein LOC126665031 [Mercurialis annua]|uniref:uncharacterized protein LOC126665031 n=1 Tax=Mercurialis annua TaxID=3986 RepID=UPI00215EE9B6|nr:uncharacterized protein LOC126665031 [Mercurialis annua]